jgi:hypothetical protein
VSKKRSAEDAFGEESMTILTKIDKQVSFLTEDVRIIATLRNKMEEDNATLRNKMEEIGEAINESTALAFDPWNELTATSIGKNAVRKEDFATRYGLTASTIPCMIAGLIPPPPTTRTDPPNLKLAHLLPRSTKAKILRSLGLNTTNVDDFRNMLVLCAGFEEAFDRQQISFVPNANPFNGGFVVIFWTDEMKGSPLYPGALQRLGDFDEWPLNLEVNGHPHVIFRRALSYHAYTCFRKWRKESPSLEPPNDCDISIYEGSYKTTRAEYLKQIAKDMKDDGSS